MKMLIAVTIAALALTVGARAQDLPLQKPSKEYIEHLRRYQKLQKDSAEEQRKHDERQSKLTIEGKGLEYWLASNIPKGYSVNPQMEVFVPLPPAPPPPAPPPPATPLPATPTPTPPAQTPPPATTPPAKP